MRYIRFNLPINLQVVTRGASWRNDLADGPLARLSAVTLAPVGLPLPFCDVDLEVGRTTVRALEAVIALGMVPAAIVFELINELLDVVGHAHPSRTTVDLADTQMDFCLTQTVRPELSAFF